MPSHPKFLHLRHAFLLAALFVTLTVAGWSDSTTPSAGPVVMPPSTPPQDTTQLTPSGTTPANKDLLTPPGNAIPGTSGNLEQKQAKPDTTPHPTAPAGDDAPIKLPDVHPISVNADRDSEIEHVVGELLEQNHYLQKPITAEMSQRWLKNYFQALDPTHLFFLQGDIDQFTGKYGNSLGDILHDDDAKTAVSPAFEIFDRYMLRVHENVALAEKLLHDKFDFTKNDTFTIRTQKSSWIADATASEALWHGQVKSDMLNAILDKKSPDEAITRLSKRYRSFLMDGEEDDDLDVLEMYLNALANAYDPHSDYMAPDEAQDFNIQAIKHIVTGIGAVLKTDDGYATIDEVIPGGPADLDKRLQAGLDVLDPALAAPMALGWKVDDVFRFV